ncbi:DUF3253 domain-containing protein [Acidisoma silvae]|uniref:DUF3253 domain-containing protein n=1 Tax=Acidisoma silvae TaxID=2802396 RepID=A0A963YRW8_9PROT|nr:DUF3253 domain-containing protein [Acidisoma silvae]MCB8875574.1 DUF3253 domain-containing protein [Acidisoma silvae]
MDELNGPADETAAAESEAKKKAPNSYEVAILDRLSKTPDGKSITPADVAMSLSENWRPVLTHVRVAARRLAEQDKIEILRHGKAIVPADMKGVIRLRLKQSQ